jgi:transposase InsO family protein
MKLPEKYTEGRIRIEEIFNSNWQCYGYRRVRAELRKSGFHLAEKVIRRLMKEGNLVAHSSCKRRRYNSYYGEIIPLTILKIPVVRELAGMTRIVLSRWFSGFTQIIYDYDA